MEKKEKASKAPAKEAHRLKKRRLGVSKHRLVEVVPREVADAEIAKLFEDSKLFPDEK
jgi:hypothetical protein